MDLDLVRYKLLVQKLEPQTDDMSLVTAILDILPIPYVFVRPTEGKFTDSYTWDGSTLTLSKKITVSNVLHELAHYQIASAARRKLPEYGLGLSPESVRRVVPTVKHNASEKEERVASILGIIWERNLGFDFRKTLHNHVWIDYRGNEIDEHDMDESLLTLYKYKLIDENGNPKLRLRGKL